MAAEAAGDEPSAGLTFLDLPVETQKEIVSHCSQADLICLALVSKHFHELASAQLYRSFQIVFPDDDDLSFESPIDGLAGGLDTFTTSDYNYAKHLKDLSMDTLSTGAKGEHAYKPYLYSASCGKFLNTLLYLTLKKSKALESFRWNIRVELSRPVYGELHKIKSLKTIHIRMQAGESYYNIPPPLPVSLDLPAGPIPMSNHWTEIPPPPPPMPATAIPFTTEPLPVIALPVQGTNGYTPVGGGPPPSLMAPSRQGARAKACRRGTESREPATLSGFKKLSSLSVLDIDDLDILTELRVCVKNSTSTLNELQLSLSDSLASQSRKPSADSDPEDSDVDDEFQVVPASPNGSFDGTVPARTFRAQEERKLQEAILGKIFGVEPTVNKKVRIEKESQEEPQTTDKDKSPEDSSEDSRAVFVSSLGEVANKLMVAINGGSRSFSAAQQGILDMIEKAARKYVESSNQPTTAPSDPSSNHADQNQAGNSDTQPCDEQHNSIIIPPSEADEPGDDSHLPAVSDSTTKQSRGHDTSSGLSPEDIDIEHLDLEDDPSEDSDPQLAKEKRSKSSDSLTATFGNPQVTSDLNHSSKMIPSLTEDEKLTAEKITNMSDEDHKACFEGLMAKLRVFQSQAEELRNRIRAMLESADSNPAHIKEAENQLAELFHFSSNLQMRIERLEREVDAATHKTSGASAARLEQTQRLLDEYIRDTRGLSLETLSIHLIPVKASVLSRALDLSCLRSLTLLNVGSQSPIWTLLAAEHKFNPLALRSVFTDNVSLSFLTCMSKLDELHELFMLERSLKHKPESFCPRSNVTIDQIRRLVLKKHMPTLKRLMIKDESSSSAWDANQKAMILICNRGSQLEELAVSMNIHAVHAFMQYFPGLVNLRAINILRFRNNDTCIWVMREILKFMVDNLSHHPELKLEWIAMEDDRIDRVVRQPENCKDSDEESEKKKDKKRKMIPFPGTSHGGSLMPELPLGEWTSDSESSDEEDAYNNGKRLRLKTVGPLQFYDVWGVKIFEKEIRTGRL